MNDRPLKRALPVVAVLCLCDCSVHKDQKEDEHYIGESERQWAESVTNVTRESARIARPRENYCKAVSARRESRLARENRISHPRRSALRVTALDAHAPESIIGRRAHSDLWE